MKIDEAQKWILNELQINRGKKNQNCKIPQRSRD